MARKFLIVFSWLLSIAFLVHWALRWLAGEHLFVVFVFNILIPWLALVFLPLTLIAVILGKRLLGTVLSLVFILAFYPYAPLFLPVHSNLPTTEKGIRILSFNIWRHNANYEAVVAVIKQYRPDIAILQEVSPEAIGIIRSTGATIYGDGYPPKILYSENLQRAVISRYDVAPANSLPNNKRLVQDVLVQTPYTRIIIWNIKASTPLRDRSTQLSEAEFLVRHSRNLNLPLIVAGDFNATEQSASYDTLNRYLQDAFHRAGWGFGFTFPSRVRRRIGVFGPLARIDHIFLSAHFSVHKAKTPKIFTGSDHLPVFAEISLIE